MKKHMMALAIVLTCACMLFMGCSKKQATDTYVFASDATWPPLEFVENGQLTGFEVELIPMIGEKVGVTMTVKNVPWDTIFAGLSNGAYDGVASGVTVTEERKRAMEFSTPILSAGQVVIIRTADLATVKGIDDLAGKTVGVQIGTTGDFSLDDYPVKKKVYDDIGLAIEDMANRNVDAVVCDSLIASDFVLANPNYNGKITVTGAPFTVEDIAIAVKKGDTKLLKLINDGLAKMEADGSLATLKAKWNIL